MSALILLDSYSKKDRSRAESTLDSNRKVKPHIGILVDKEIEPGERFNVVQYFADGSYEYVRKNILIEEAKDVLGSCIKSVGARMGTTVKILMTDMMDFTLFHWEHGKGIIFPILIKEHKTVQ